MVNLAWRPADLEDVDERWSRLKIPSDVTSLQAEKLMVQFLEARDDWLNAYVNATYYEDICSWKYESSYNLAFMQADAKTDKGKDILAKSDTSVRIAKLNAIEAHAAVLKTKMKVDSATLAHHACKKIYEESSQERRWA